MSNPTFLSPPRTCEYLPDRLSRTRYELNVEISPAEYMRRLKAGWRRFGPTLFQPECADCQECQSLRIPVKGFRPNQSQHRAWKRNVGEMRLQIGSPSITPEKQKLFAGFHQHGHEAKGWPLGADLDVFMRNPFPTEEWDYYVGDRLVGVGYVDALPEGLSAIYFYWDPAEARRGLGTFNILQMIEIAEQRTLPHVYLGYYVEGCRSLEYKARFRPNEILTERKWGALRGCGVRLRPEVAT